MKKILILLLLLITPNIVLADYAGGYIKRVYTGQSGWTYVGLTTQPPNTCNSWGEHFKFDSSTPGGKNMLSIIMAAKMANKGVNVWYTPSTAVGTDQYSGCNGGTIAILNTVGLP